MRFKQWLEIRIDPSAPAKEPTPDVRAQRDAADGRPTAFQTYSLPNSVVKRLNKTKPIFQDQPATGAANTANVGGAPG